MRKCLLSALVLLLLLTACGQSTSDNASAIPEKTVKTTVMIYMVGSDLESKAGAGTADMEEITASGIDLKTNDVLIYTGGSPYWHNDIVTERENYILRLTDNGFECLQSVPLASMGDPQSLTSFVNFCTQEYPADSYGLIMWNHGNGPIMGFGKDMLYDYDALTLNEMCEAMQATQFNADNKLDWVGFDACLMSSAELAFIWKDYANYLIASQEIEPSFGWDYSFMGQLGKCDTTALLTALAETYLSTSQAYYEKKGYDQRDITLSCIDLSCAQELTQAIEGLFAKLSEDVDKNYAVLAAGRVSTRALGRASTGSEYDLVDLKSMAQQLLSAYPVQAQGLIDAIDRSVVINATNADGLSGLSLYYPFYNKDYYRNSWSEEYRSMNVFANYVEYLQGFEAQWLDNDMLEKFAESRIPQQEAVGKYTLELTQQQQEHFASAKYYILNKEAEQTYTPIFTSSDVTNVGGKLIANFDGNVLYAKNNYGLTFIPPTVQHDTVGDVTNYSVFVNLSNTPAGSFADYPEDFEQEVLSGRFWIALDRSENSVSVNALLPYDENLSTLGEGKTEDIDLTGKSCYNFPEARHRTLERNEDGLVPALDQWRYSSDLTWLSLPIGDGLEFLMAPLAYGNYAIVFEIQDAQGNLYCSEPIEIDTPQLPPLQNTFVPERVKTTWDSSKETLIKEENGIKAYLAEVESENGSVLTLLVENGSDKDILVEAEHLICNNTVYANEYLCSIVVPAGTTKYYEYGFNFSDVVDCGILTALDCVDFSVTAQEHLSQTTIWCNLQVHVDFGKHAPYTIPFLSWDPPGTYSDLQPVCGAAAVTQTLVEHADVLVELLDFGTQNSSYADPCPTMVLHVVNRSDRILYLACDGFVLNDVFVNTTKLIHLPAGLEGYYYVRASSTDYELLGITDITTVKAAFRAGENELRLWQGYGEVYWVDIQLSEAAPKASAFEMGDEVIFRQNGITVALKGYSEKYSQKWYLAIDNQSGQDISLVIQDIEVNGVLLDKNAGRAPYILDAVVGTGQKTLTNISTYSSDELIETLTFRFVIMDFTQGRVLFYGDDTVTVYRQAE